VNAFSISYSQNSDRNWKCFKNEKNPDSLRFKAIDDLIWDNYLYDNPDTALYFIDKQISFSLKIKNIKYQAIALNSKGVCYYVKNELDNAIKYYKQSLKCYQKINDLNGIGVIHNNLGTIYKEKGDLAKAIDYYIRSLETDEKLQNYEGMGTSLNNIGIIYASQENFSKALEYYLKSIKCLKKINNTDGTAEPLNNIGNVYESKGDYLEAIKYYEKSLKIEKKVHNVIGVATSLNNIGGVYRILGDVAYKEKDKKNAFENYERAIDFSEQAIGSAKSVGDNTMISYALLNIGSIHAFQGNDKKAIEYNEKAINIAKQTGSVRYIRDAASALYSSYKKMGQGDKALAMHELFIKMRDSISSEENRDEIVRQEFKYEYEKQATADSVVQVKERQVTNAQFKQEKTQRIALVGGLILVLVFSFFLYKRYKVTFNQKEIISLKEKETNRQKILLEVKNKEIMDSITYAKRIQSAILPPAKIVKEYLKESFILYKPRDIVAGDFYWMEQIQDGLIFAAADCTGHGVPGAMVSVVCNNALNRSVREYGLTDPGEILDKARELIISEFDQSDDDMKDGMDISLCTLEFEPVIMPMGTNDEWSEINLKWAGANNPLCILRDNELIEYKGNKQPIGYFSDPLPFTTHSIPLKQNDIIYIFTDGYQDQFGGDLKHADGKKFKVSRMKELFLSVSHLPMSEQKEIIDKSFEDWKRDLEQVDDVCVIGVRV
jgi:tetratricopeptide (TPR) repeat protein